MVLSFQLTYLYLNARLSDVEEQRVSRDLHDTSSVGLLLSAIEFQFSSNNGVDLKYKSFLPVLARAD